MDRRHGLGRLRSRSRLLKSMIGAGLERSSAPEYSRKGSCSTPLPIGRVALVPKLVVTMCYSRSMHHSGRQKENIGHAPRSQSAFANQVTLMKLWLGVQGGNASKAIKQIWLLSAAATISNVSSQQARAEHRLIDDWLFLWPTMK
jgi:hypothetical protein